MPRDFARRPSLSCTLEAVSFSARSNREMMACSASIAASLRLRSDNNVRCAPYAREFGAGSGTRSLLVLSMTFPLVTTDLPQSPHQLSSCVKLLRKCVLLARDVRRSDEGPKKSMPLKSAAASFLQRIPPTEGQGRRSLSSACSVSCRICSTAVSVCKKPTCTASADGAKTANI